jgi:hypothetical protein
VLSSENSRYSYKLKMLNAESYIMPDDKLNPPNLDLIQMVQQARMQHDADAVPSEMGGVYWIEVKPASATQSPTPRAGLWLIETDTAHIDAQWAAVKAATQAGKLGYKSKASTRPRGGQGGADSRVICVCTYDRADAADVERVRIALAELSLIPSRYE